MFKKTAIFLIFMILSFKAQEFGWKIDSLEERKNNLISFLSEQTEGVVEEVMSLLTGLEDKAKKELETEIARWKLAGKNLRDILQDFKTQKNEQNEEVLELKGKIEDLTNKIAATNQTIIDNTETMETQKNELKDLLDRRCEATKVYINSLKNNRDALRLFGIIREAVNGFNPSFLDVSELQQVMKRFGNFINIYAKDHFQVFADILKDVRERSDEEIGTKHVDNNKKEITMQKLTKNSVEALTSVKDKLLALVAKIEKEIKQSMDDLEQDEINANSDAADFQRQVEEERVRLTKENKTLNLLLIELQQTLEETIASKVIADQKLADLILLVKTADANYKKEEALHNQKIKRLRGEIKLFGEVVHLYREQVLGAAEAVKNRVEDYNEDKKFDKTSETTKRKVEKFEPLEGEVKENIETEAAAAQ